MGSPTAFPITAQLYFDGEIDAETAEEYSDCCQKITPLGFKWNGYDVILIETKYTFMDYPEQTELFGVDSGIENPFMQEETEETVVNVDSTALIGKWIDLESDWEDTYIFNADGTGSYTSGFEYAFTYKVEGNTLTVIYAEDDTESYTVTVDSSKQNTGRRSLCSFALMLSCLERELLCIIQIIIMMLHISLPMANQ